MPQPLTQCQHLCLQRFVGKRMQRRSLALDLGNDTTVATGIPRKCTLDCTNHTIGQPLQPAQAREFPLRIGTEDRSRARDWLRLE
jgi:hypothetical protein